MSCNWCLFFPQSCHTTWNNTLLSLLCVKKHFYPLPFKCSTFAFIYSNNTQRTGFRLRRIVFTDLFLLNKHIIPIVSWSGVKAKIDFWNFSYLFFLSSIGEVKRFCLLLSRVVLSVCFAFLSLEHSSVMKSVLIFIFLSCLCLGKNKTCGYGTKSFLSFFLLHSQWRERFVEGCKRVKSQGIKLNLNCSSKKVVSWAVIIKSSIESHHSRMLHDQLELSFLYVPIQMQSMLKVDFQAHSKYIFRHRAIAGAANSA